MLLAQRIAEVVPRLPPELRRLLDMELAAGSKITDVEYERGMNQGKVAVILEHPFRTASSEAPAGVVYREIVGRDLMIFEFLAADELFSLVTAKFKPMELPALGDGPPNPTEAHIAFMKQRAIEQEEAAARRAAVQEPAAPIASHSTSEAAQKFMKSMNMHYEMWHDGTGYDLEALARTPPREQAAIESILIKNSQNEWRDIEALAVINSPRARAAIEAALRSPDARVRREAMKYAAEKVDPRGREAFLVRDLEKAGIFSGLTPALDDVKEFHPPGVIDALLRGALHRHGDVAVHFAAMLFFLHGKSEEPFDWKQRPFFLKFNTPDRTERERLFHELCEAIGVDAGKYIR